MAAAWATGLGLGRVAAAFTAMGVDELDDVYAMDKDDFASLRNAAEVAELKKVRGARVF